MDLAFMAEIFVKLLEGVPLTLKLAFSSVALGRHRGARPRHDAHVRASRRSTGLRAATSSCSAARRSSSRCS